MGDGYAVAKGFGDGYAVARGFAGAAFGGGALKRWSIEDASALTRARWPRWKTKTYFGFFSRL